MMVYIAVFLIGVFAGAIVISLTVTSSRDELEEEKYNAENRATDYARIIKAIEDIYYGKGTIIDKYDAIGKILKGGK